MRSQGMVRVTAISPKVAIGDTELNVARHVGHILEHRNDDVLVFPELSLTGYTC